MATKSICEDALSKKFKRIRDTLNLCILPTAIAQANHEIQKVNGSKKKKRRPHKWYSASVGAAVGKYASQHGVHVAASARYFSSKLCIFLNRHLW